MQLPCWTKIRLKDPLSPKLKRVKRKIRQVFLRETTQRPSEILNCCCFYGIARWKKKATTLHLLRRSSSSSTRVQVLTSRLRYRYPLMSGCPQPGAVYITIKKLPQFFSPTASKKPNKLPYHASEIEGLRKNCHLPNSSLHLDPAGPSKACPGTYSYPDRHKIFWLPYKSF